MNDNENKPGTPPADVDAMLKHARKQLLQRTNQPLVKHGRDTWRGPINGPAHADSEGGELE